MVYESSNNILFPIPNDYYSTLWNFLWPFKSIVYGLHIINRINYLSPTVSIIYSTMRISSNRLSHLSPTASIVHADFCWPLESLRYLLLLLSRRPVKASAAVGTINLQHVFITRIIPAQPSRDPLLAGSWGVTLSASGFWGYGVVASPSGYSSVP